MIAYILVGLGGAFGSILRFTLGNLLPATMFTSFPLQILIINILGCCAMGFITELMDLLHIYNSNLKNFLTTGLLGGFTTFSSFALNFGQLIEKDLLTTALTYAIISLTSTLTAFFIGLKLAKIIFN